MNAPSPTVTYVDAAEVPAVGKRIKVQVLDHPRFLPGCWVTTSAITFVVGEKFLTNNTAYIPSHRDDADNLKRLTELAQRQQDERKRAKETR
jgi:hypothetical protein